MLNLEVDTDDSHAYTSDESFGLVVTDPTAWK